jgi:phosphotransferase system enzyme I (PtsI)
MVGIVVVSHSPRLAEAAVALALEMVPAAAPRIAVAAGAGDGRTGTDAVRVSEAISEVASPDGVLVFMDLGSAVLSAEMSLEFMTDRDFEVRLTSAPFVEGLLAGVVRAAGGATLDEVDREARGALFAKTSQLGELDGEEPPTTQSTGAQLSADLVLRNRDGMHARPAALVVGLLTGLEVAVTVERLGAGRPAALTGPTALLAVGGRQGETLRFAASGPDAAVVLERIGQLVRDGFGESLEPAPEKPAMSPTDDPGEAALASGAIGVSPGRAVAEVVRMPEPIEEPAEDRRLTPGTRADESLRIASSATKAAVELRRRAADASDPARGILEATASLAEDAGLLEEARERVLVEGSSAERAVWDVFGTRAEALRAQGGRTAERVSDLHDVRARIIANLLGRPAPGVPQRSEPYVLVAHDLAPADTALLDPAVCVALVTEKGGPTSHTAILARSLGIPAVVAARGAWSSPGGTIVLVDGSTGELIWDPSDEQAAEVRSTPETAPFDGHGRTRDGVAVSLLANVGRPESAAEGAEAKAQGVGLFRTEFCFLDREEAPSIDEQVTAYRRVLAAFPGQRVIVRTLDAGADKPLVFVTPDHEDNPALGIRGYRTSWRRPEVLDDQLAAIARAARAEQAEVGVMAPMIDTVGEAERFAAHCRTHGITDVGVMIETPSAALTAADILQVVDFVSLGTNDLAQYTMAADRLVGELAALNDPWQPAVLKLVAAVGAAGAAAGKSVGVCGEAAADPLLAVVLVGAGATSLSMTPRALAAVAARLGRVTLDQCRAAATAATGARSAAEARAAVRSLLS